jgi:4,5-dihydroxyphthalate decarboxylase
MEIIPDPLPYGVEPNRAVLEELIGHAVSQGIIARRIAPESLFVPAVAAVVA